MKTWLKGGIIGAIAHLVYFLLFLPWIFTQGGETLMGWIFVLTEMLPVMIIFRPIQSIADSHFVLGSFLIGLIVTIYWFIIGALIGLIIGKIKSKKQIS